MIIGGSGQKAATSLLAGKEGLHYTVGGVQQTTGAKYTSLAQNYNTQTIVDVTGSGVLTFCYGMGTVNGAGMRITITLDGVVVYNQNKTNVVNYGNSVAGNCYQVNAGSGGSTSRDYIPFNTSMLITAVDSNSSGSVHLFYDYYLT